MYTHAQTRVYVNQDGTCAHTTANKHTCVQQRKGKLTRTGGGHTRGEREIARRDKVGKDRHVDVYGVIRFEAWHPGGGGGGGSTGALVRRRALSRSGCMRGMLCS